MSVLFFDCIKCKRSINDAGHYFGCECGRSYCSDACGGMTKDDDNQEYCIGCRNEWASDDEILQFVYSLFKKRPYSMHDPKETLTKWLLEMRKNNVER